MEMVAKDAGVNLALPGMDVPQWPASSTSANSSKSKSAKPHFLEFFAGSGLVAKGLERYFQPVWANDV